MAFLISSRLRISLAAGAALAIVAGVSFWRLLDAPAAAIQAHAACATYVSAVPRIDPGYPPEGWTRAFVLDHDGRKLAYGPIVGHYWRLVENTAEPQVCGLHYNTDRAYGSQVEEGLLLYTVHGYLARLAIRDDAVPAPDPGATNSIRYVQDFPDAAIAPPGEPGYVYWQGAYDADLRTTTPYGFWLQHLAVAAFRFDMGQHPADHAMPVYPYTRDVVPGVDADYAPRLIFDAGPQPLR